MNPVICAMCGLASGAPGVKLSLAWALHAYVHPKCWPTYGSIEDHPRAEILTDLEGVVTWTKKTSTQS